MKEIRFNQDKNKELKLTRGISFDEIAEIIKKVRTTTIEHPNKKRYPKQRISLVKIKNHIYAVPFIEEDDYIFLKTIYPSEKYTKKLLKVK
ncbi:MAG: hypothetical protein ACD_12C00206G0006 [uncultured bacterium]|nr:MAG: hypothetical protein ACD_12C00206G0006 [uncultured bacterium]